MMDAKPFSPEWLRAELKRTGHRQRDLVSYLAERGVAYDATKLSKTLATTRSVQPNEMQPIWEFFGHSVADLGAAIAGMPTKNDPATRKPENPLPNAGLPEKLSFDPERLPIWGSSIGGDSRHRTLFNGQRLGTVSRPSSLADNPRAYATYVHGDSMEPRYDAGIIVLVNPDKGYKKGDFVVAQVYDNDGDPPFGYVKKFISFNDQELVLEQLNPPLDDDKIMRFARQNVVSVHRIVGTLDE